MGGQAGASRPGRTLNVSVGAEVVVSFGGGQLTATCDQLDQKPEPHFPQFLSGWHYYRMAKKPGQLHARSLWQLGRYRGKELTCLTHH